MVLLSAIYLVARAAMIGVLSERDERQAKKAAAALRAPSPVSPKPAAAKPAADEIIQ